MRYEKRKKPVHQITGSILHNGEQSVFGSDKKGFLSVVPVLFLGAIALVIKSLPVAGFQNFLENRGGGILLIFLNGIYEATYGLLSIYLAISISLYSSRKIFQGKHYTQGLTMVLSVICLAESLGITKDGFSYKEFGSTGVFTAIVISLLVPILYKKIQTLFFGKDIKDFIISEEMDNALFIGSAVPFVGCVLIFSV
jgi:Phosphotransferase system cellobiose-specific component IIC